MEAQSLDFDPSTLNEVTNDDGSPFFGENYKLAGLEKFKGEKGQAKLAKAFLDTEAFKGKAISPLPEDASDEQRAEFNTKLGKMLGIPDSPDGYEIKFDENLPDGLKIADDVLAEARKLAKQHNITPGALQDMVNLQTQLRTKELDKLSEFLATQTETVAKELESELGHDNYVKGLENVKRYLRKFAASDDEFNQFGETTYKNGVSSNKILLKALIEAANKAGDGTIIKGDNISQTSTEKPASEQLADSIYTHPTSQAYKKK